MTELPNLCDQKKEPCWQKKEFQATKKRNSIKQNLQPPATHFQCRNVHSPHCFSITEPIVYLQVGIFCLLFGTCTIGILSL